MRSEGYVPGYDDNDTVIVGFPGEFTPDIEESTRHACEKCGATVRVSPDSMNTVLDNINERGGKLRIICMNCCPQEAYDNIFLSDEQKSVMREHGMDIEKEARERGITIKQLGRIAVMKMQIRVELNRLETELHRAAKEGIPYKEIKEISLDCVPCKDGRGGLEPNRVIGLLMAMKMIGNQEEGAIPFGRKVRKIGDEPGDRTPAGTLGEVMGSISSPEGAFLIEGKTVTYGYLIKWTTDDLPVFTTDLKVEEV